MSRYHDFMEIMDLATPREVGDAIKTRRIQLGLRQRDLAERAFVSRQWIIKLEAGHDNAELARLLAVMQALGLSLAFREAEEERPGEFDLDNVFDR